MNRIKTASAALLATALLSACSFGSQSAVPGARPNGNGFGTIPSTTGAGKIKHVVFVIQQGRSFNTLFEGYPGAKTVSSGELSDGKTIALQPIRLKEYIEVDDSVDAMFQACNGTGKLPGTACQMNGFDKEQWYGSKHLLHPQYVYVSHDDTKPYFAMAHEWVLSDNTFASQLDGSFIAHQYAIAAQAGKAAGVPTGGPCVIGSKIPKLSKKRTVYGVEKACFSYTTLGGELDQAKLPWRYYLASLGSAPSPYSWIDGFFKNPDERKHIVWPPQQFLTDVKAGKLGAFSWVTPDCADSDEGRCGADGGPAWVASVVNAVGESKFWDSTAIFVMWEDWGGFYDPVAPAYENFDSLGFRVPLLAISPYAKRDYVSHVPYESASVLRFAEDLFGLPQMAAADRRATSPAADCFDFSQRPRKFVPIKP